MLALKMTIRGVIVGSNCKILTSCHARHVDYLLGKKYDNFTNGEWRSVVRSSLTLGRWQRLIKNKKDLNVCNARLMDASVEIG